jgi:hypothetical protein
MVKEKQGTILVVCDGCEERINIFEEDYDETKKVLCGNCKDRPDIAIDKLSDKRWRSIRRIVNR